MACGLDTPSHMTLPVRLGKPDLVSSKALITTTKSTKPINSLYCKYCEVIYKQVEQDLITVDSVVVQ